MKQIENIKQNVFVEHNKREPLYHKQHLNVYLHLRVTKSSSSAPAHKHLAGRE